MNYSETVCLNSKVNGRQPSIQDRIYSIKGVSTAVTTCFHTNIMVRQSIGARDGVFGTICAGYYKEGVYNLLDPHSQRCNGVKIMDEQQQEYRVRKLTERECFRLMGVRDDDIDAIQSSGIPRTQQYKLAGNSIVCDVLMAIFSNLLIADDNDDLF